MEGMEGLKGKSILVTGGTGFVGSHLVEALVDKGAKVIVPFRSLDPRSYFATRKLSDMVIMVSGDLRDNPRIFNIVVKHEIDYIFHLGAQAIVTTAYHDPVETIETNVMGTTNILDAARRFPHVKAVLVASSDKAYGKSTKAYKETDPLLGDHPYEVSKAATDLIARAYYKTYGVPVVVTRFGNIFGPGDLNASRIIPGIMKTLITKEVLKLRSDGTHVRDYVYVKDVVSGYLFLLQNLGKAVGDIFNFSSDDNMNVVDLIKHIGKITSKKIPYVIENSAKNEIPYQHVDYAKISAMGWKPEARFANSIFETLRWYTQNKPF